MNTHTIVWVVVGAAIGYYVTSHFVMTGQAA